MLQADCVDNAEGVEPTLDEPTTVSQGAAREQHSVSAATSSQSCGSPATSSQSCVSPATSSQSCVSPATSSQSYVSSEKSSTHTSVQRERRYPDRIRNAPKRLDV